MKAIADEVHTSLRLQGRSAPEDALRKEHREFVDKQIASLRAKTEAAEAKIAQWEIDLGKAFSARQIQDLQGQINILQSQIDTWQGHDAQLLNSIQGGSPNYLAVIEAAQVPGAPISPRPMRNVQLAAAIGFILAAGAAFLMEYLDDTIKSPDDIVKTLGLSPLGLSPE